MSDKINDLVKLRCALHRIKSGKDEQGKELSMADIRMICTAALRYTKVTDRDLRYQRETCL